IAHECKLEVAAENLLAEYRPDLRDAEMAMAQLAKLRQRNALLHEQANLFHVVFRQERAQRLANRMRPGFRDRKENEPVPVGYDHRRVNSAGQTTIVACLPPPSSNESAAPAWPIQPALAGLAMIPGPAPDSSRRIVENPIGSDT